MKNLLNNYLQAKKEWLKEVQKDEMSDATIRIENIMVDLELELLEKVNEALKLKNAEAAEAFETVCGYDWQKGLEMAEKLINAKDVA